MRFGELTRFVGVNRFLFFLFGNRLVFFLLTNGPNFWGAYIWVF